MAELNKNKHADKWYAKTHVMFVARTSIEQVDHFKIAQTKEILRRVVKMLKCMEIGTPWPQPNAGWIRKLD